MKQIVKWIPIPTVGNNYIPGVLFYPTLCDSVNIIQTSDGIAEISSTGMYDGIYRCVIDKYFEELYIAALVTPWVSEPISNGQLKLQIN